jgi:fructose-1,6-bisphosphatase/inositol monophosphatase family enzyme
MVDWLNLFMDTATAIRKEVRPMLGTAQARESHGRGAGGDVAHSVDIAAEDIVIRRLEKERIPCVLISEEIGTRPINGGGPDHVVLDPVDGTTNALRYIPFSSTSIAHATGSWLRDVDVGLVMDLYSGMVFTAKEGEGAYLNGSKTTASKLARLDEAIVSVELTYSKRVRTLTRIYMPLMERTLKLRLLGSTALEIAYVASGALDAFVDMRGLTRSVDLAAATLIAREAGGLVVTPDGEELNMELKATARSSFIASGNYQLASEIVELLGKGVDTTLI